MKLKFSFTLEPLTNISDRVAELVLSLEEQFKSMYILLTLSLIMADFGLVGLSSSSSS